MHSHTQSHTGNIHISYKLLCLLLLSGEEIRGHQDTQSIKTHKRKWAGCREKMWQCRIHSRERVWLPWPRSLRWLTEPPEHREGTCPLSRLPAPAAQFQSTQPEHRHTHSVPPPTKNWGARWGGKGGGHIKTANGYTRQQVLSNRRVQSSQLPEAHSLTCRTVKISAQLLYD